MTALADRPRIATAEPGARGGRLRVQAAAASLLGPATGLLAGLTMPRGPVTAAGALILMAAEIARPAATPQIVDAHGARVPGSIAELDKIRIGGVDQWIQIRAWSADKPVLLYIPGGPGQSDLAISRALLTDITRDFVVVTWDGRGIGKAYPSYDAAKLTTDRVVADTVELTNYLRRRFDERKIYLFGESGGSVIFYPHWQSIDFRRTAERLAVPVYLFSGDHELAGRRDLALAWFRRLQAPRKRLYSWPDAGHATAFEHFGAFRQILTRTVVPETYAQP